jgi:hypothetical protein
VSRFLEHAARLLEAAETAAQSDAGASDLTVLVGRDCGIQIVMDSDWSAEALRADRGAEMAFQVNREGGCISVKGYGVGQSCRLDAMLPARTARTLLGTTRLYAISGTPLLGQAVGAGSD